VAEVGEAKVEFYKRYLGASAMMFGGAEHRAPQG